jgi:hypothetical protein
MDLKVWFLESRFLYMNSINTESEFLLALPFYIYMSTLEKYIRIISVYKYMLSKVESTLKIVECKQEKPFYIFTQLVFLGF